MALKAGRVGVAPDQVDEFGYVKSDATSGYTKQEADAKFETQTHAASTYETKSDAAALQPMQLSVPIELLSGSMITTVEEGFSGLKDALTNKELTDIVSVHETAVTDIITGASVDGDRKYVRKSSHVCNLDLHLLNVTTTADWAEVVARIPVGYRPVRDTRVDVVIGGASLKTANIGSDGTIKIGHVATNQSVILSATWITA